MDHGARELSQVGEVSLLAGGPWGRNSKKSMSEKFVVRKNCKISTFQHKAKMLERRVGSSRSNAEYFFSASVNILE